MNKDEFAGQWKQIRGQARQWWGKLTEDELERAGGKLEQFVGVLQARYGYTRQSAEAEINRRFAGHAARQRKAAFPAKKPNRPAPSTQSGSRR
jgi:uncharacterized protein YjbJ (UPF0337 family)